MNHSFANAARLALRLSMLLLPSGLFAADEMELLLRDAQSGAPLEATLSLYPLAQAQAATRESVAAAISSPAASTVFAQQGRARLPVDGPTLLLAQSPGHAPLAVLLQPGAQGWTLWLSPQETRAADADDNGDVLRLTGMVRDAASLQPVAGAEVRLLPGDGMALSAADGSFTLAMPLAETPADTGFLQLEVRAAGHPRLLDRAIPRVAGSVWRIVDLGAGEPALHRQQLPPLLAMQSADPGDRHAPAGTSGPDQPPLSVRVGFNDASCTQVCCTGSCSNVCVFDLETYVRRGITYEWIGSWAQHSLRAGSLAYRSYGAWHALNPPASRPYDICSSACCQVNGPNVIAAGTQAARATAGLMLKRNDAVFRAEYSAENNCRLGTLSCSNNDLSCGNGYNGSPASGWPCLQDAVGLDRDCFGHGRGMSQWGTQRWAGSPHLQRWPWIVNHYYNAGGTGSGMRTATMTRVLEILGAVAEPAVVVPGASFDIALQTLNRAAQSHQAVLVGASIRRGSDPWISDPANDQPAELAAGTGIATRDFVVPAGTPPGNYALWVSLYLDIDGDGAISSADLVQSLVQFPDALIVDLAEEPLFADGFDGQARD